MSKQVTITSIFSKHMISIFCLMIALLFSTTGKVQADINSLTTHSDNNFAVLLGHYNQVAHDSTSTTYDITVDNNQGAWYYVSVTPSGNGPNQSGLPDHFVLAPGETDHNVGRVKFYNKDRLKLVADGSFSHIEVPEEIAADALHRMVLVSHLPSNEDEATLELFTSSTAHSDAISLANDLNGNYLTNSFAIIGDLANLCNDDAFRTAFAAEFGTDLPSGFFFFAKFLASAGSIALLEIETLDASFTNSIWDGLAFEATIISSGGGGGGGGGTATYSNATYVADVTIPDGTSFSGNQGFNKIWQVKNTGSTSWDGGYHWTFDGGDKMGGPDSINVPSVSPGNTWNPSINLQAPGGAGSYRGYWRMQAPDGHKFGDRVWVQIQVSNTGSDNAIYIADITIPDNTAFSTNQGFNKIWRIKNLGSTSWGSGYHWTFDGGTQMSGPGSIDVPSVGPGGTWDPSINLQAPGSAGTYRGYWRMQAPDGHKFGDRVWVQIQVSQGGANVSTFVSESDTASGPDQPGFWRQGTPSYWHDATDAGDGGHMFWTYNNDNAHGTDDIGFWRPNLPNTQPYEVFVFIPRNHATTTQAHYTVYYANGQTDVSVNQNSYYDQWVSLGTYQFNSGTGGFLRLVDQTGEAYASKWIGFDSAQWQPRSSVPPATAVTTVVSESDTAPYDGAPGFFRHGTPQYWYDAGFGDGGHMYWTYNNDPAHGSDDIGDWRPNLAVRSKYEVFAFIPNNYANTTQAHYTVYNADGQADVYVDQSKYFNQWVSLGTYRFNSGTGGLLRLVDQTNERYTSKWIGFDTAQWQPRAGYTNAPSNLQPSNDAVVNPSINFSWQDNGMDDGNPSHDFQIQVWRVVNGQRSDQVWSSDWRAGTNRGWSAPGPGEYEWVVQAGNGINQSAASGPARFIVPAPIPDAPSGLIATALSPLSIQLVWQDNSDIETGFKIERESAGSGYTQIGTSGANVNHFTDVGLTPNTTYTYRVRAANDAGNSGYTNEASASTPADYSVVSVTLAPNLVPGGTSTVGTVVLSGPALPSGSLITLYSSNAVAAVPTTVTIPAGAYTATFPVNTQPVSVNTPMSITAANSVASTSATLTVQAPTLTSLTFPSPVPGGTVVTATVTLSSPALSDVVVGLSSSDSSIVRLHRAVIIPAGNASATFQINTYRSHVTKTVTIQASLDQVVQTQDLTIAGR